SRPAARRRPPGPASRRTMSLSSWRPSPPAMMPRHRPWRPSLSHPPRILQGMEPSVLDASCPDHPYRVTRAFERRVASAAGVLNAAHGALVDLMVEALRERFWQGWGIHTPVQWLMWRAGTSRHTARQVLRLAVRADELPATLQLLR